MKIPSNAIIPVTKLTRYLLVLRARSDKSKFLAQAGFTPENHEALEAALRELILTVEATCDRTDEYSTFYQVIGILQGINGINLGVTTIWLHRKIDQQYQLVNLVPNKEGRSMKLELYQEIAINRDFPEHNLHQGDMATLIDYVPHPEQGEEGAILEASNALGNTISVVTVPISSIVALQASDIPSIRRLAQAS